MIEDKLCQLMQEIEHERAKCKPGPERDELAAQLADLQLASQSIAVRAATRREQTEKADRHAQIVPLCRAALDEVKRLTIEQGKAEEDLAIAHGKLEGAERREREAHDQKPRPETYPSRAEIMEWRQFVDKREAAVSAARLALKEAVEARDQIARSLFDAKKKLAQLEFTERQLRPRSKPELIESGGTLSAVR